MRFTLMLLLLLGGSYSSAQTPTTADWAGGNNQTGMSTNSPTIYSPAISYAAAPAGNIVGDSIWAGYTLPSLSVWPSVLILEGQCVALGNIASEALPGAGIEYIANTQLNDYSATVNNSTYTTTSVIDPCRPGQQTTLQLCYGTGATGSLVLEAY